jgi:hypothetical protein
MNDIIFSSNSLKYYESVTGLSSSNVRISVDSMIPYPKTRPHKEWYDARIAPA